MSISSRVARGLLGLPFIWLGYEAASEPGRRVALAEATGVPSPELAVKANGVAMVAGGAALATGILPRTAAVGLVASLIPTTLAGHAFWKDEDPAARVGNRIQVLKNVGLIGGLLLVASSD